MCHYFMQSCLTRTTMMLPKLCIAILLESETRLFAALSTSRLPEAGKARLFQFCIDYESRYNLPCFRLDVRAYGNATTCHKIIETESAPRTPLLECLTC